MLLSFRGTMQAYLLSICDYWTDLGSSAMLIGRPVTIVILSWIMMLMSTILAAVVLGWGLLNQFPLFVNFLHFQLIKTVFTHLIIYYIHI